jgi:hypothetical protein
MNLFIEVQPCSEVKSPYIPAGQKHYMSPSVLIRAKPCQAKSGMCMQPKKDPRVKVSGQRKNIQYTPAVNILISQR